MFTLSLKLIVTSMVIKWQDWYQTLSENIVNNMTVEQIENALKVMYSQVKQLKDKVSDLEKEMEMYSTLDLSEERKKKRDYWNVDNRTNR
jgi:uncharacterized membrane protein